MYMYIKRYTVGHFLLQTLSELRAASNLWENTKATRIVILLIDVSINIPPPPKISYDRCAFSMVAWIQILNGW